MKKSLILGVAGVLAVVLSGCTLTEQHTAGGAITGAAIGGLITGDMTGALVGGLAGGAQRTGATAAFERGAGAAQAASPGAGCAGTHADRD